MFGHSYLEAAPALVVLTLNCMMGSWLGAPWFNSWWPEGCLMDVVSVHDLCYSIRVVANNCLCSWCCSASFCHSTNGQRESTYPLCHSLMAHHRMQWQPASYLPIPTSLLPPIFRCRRQACSWCFLLLLIVGKAFQTLHILGLFVSVFCKSDGAGFLKRTRLEQVFFNVGIKNVNVELQKLSTKRSQHTIWCPKSWEGKNLTGYKHVIYFLIWTHGEGGSGRP